MTYHEEHKYVDFIGNYLMAFANLASTAKLHRVSQIITEIGSNGKMKFYTGSVPASPDIATTGTLLASLSLSSTAGVASLAVQSGLIVSAGATGTDGVYNVVISGGGGSGATATYQVHGGALTSITVTANGSGYTTAPTFGGFGSSGLSGATATAIMTGILVFNSVTPATAVATGVTGFVRITKSNDTPVIDLDVGTTNAFSVIMDSTFISSGGMVTCSTDVLIEG
jgi:hypothetical protein